MSHRFTYHPGHGLIYLILSGVISLLLPTPLTAVHLSGGTEDPGVGAPGGDPGVGVSAPETLSSAPHFYLNGRVRQCVRDWSEGSQAGFWFYVSFSLVLDFLVLLCLAGCTVVVQVS